MRLLSGLAFIVALGSVMFATKPAICDSDNELAQLLPPSISSYCSANPVNGILLGPSSRKIEVYYYQPFSQMRGGSGHQVLAMIVYKSRVESTAMYSNMSVEWGFLDVSSEPGQKWIVATPLALFPEESNEPRCWHVEYVADTCFVYARLRPGLPEDSDPVYRLKDATWFQTSGSLSDDIRRASRFLRLEADRKTISVVDGTGTSSTQYASDRELEPSAIEISTKYLDGGFNSVWGVRGGGDANNPGWAKLWLLTARATNDGKKIVRTREINAELHGQTNKDWSSTFRSPDVTSDPTAKLYVWRNTESSKNRTASLWDLCSFGIDGRVALLDRFCMTEDQKTKRMRWDLESKRWIAESIVNPKWLPFPPTLAVTRESDFVVSRADGLLIVLR